MTVIVYKIGGSLLSLPDLPRRISGALAQRTGTHALLISGGGEAANIVREWDRLHQLGEERAHWLALKSLRLNEALLRALLPESPIVDNRQQAEKAWAAGQLPILCADEFLNTEESAGADPLPHNWDVTSDSIAAWTAVRWPAAELVLLKSTALPEACTLRDAAEQQLVDPYFPQLAIAVPQISWCDLRAESPILKQWR